MKIPTICACTFIFLALLVHGFTPTGIGQAELPEWKVGYKWKYESLATDFDVNFTIEVLDTTTLKLNGSKYDVYLVRITSEMSNTGTNSVITTDDYIKRSNLAKVKSVTTYPGPTGNLTYIERVYQPPKKDYDFPLEVGKSWSFNLTEIEYAEGLGYSNYTKRMNYTVMGKESVKVKAGTFECYKIKINEGYGVIQHLWYSSKVNNIVKNTCGSGGLDVPMELTSYALKAKSYEGFNIFAMPYILLLILIPVIVVIFIMLLIRKRKMEQEIKRRMEEKKKKKKKK